MAAWSEQRRRRLHRRHTDGQAEPARGIRRAVTHAMRRTKERFKLDSIDVNILVQLLKDGRMTNVNLASAVGLSASPCLQRVKRLEAAGYIVGYGAQINLSKLADTVTVFTEVTLADHRRQDFIKFEASIRNVDEVLECHLVSGGYDYLLRFIARSITHYQELMETLLESNIGIEKYFSYIVIKSPIAKSTIPLKNILSQR